MCVFICVQVNMYNILRKTARKTWTIAFSNLTVVANTYNENTIKENNENKMSIL